MPGVMTCLAAESPKMLESGALKGQVVPIRQAEGPQYLMSRLRLLLSKHSRQWKGSIIQSFYHSTPCISLISRNSNPCNCFPSPILCSLLLRPQDSDVLTSSSRSRRGIPSKSFTKASPLHCQSALTMPSTETNSSVASWSWSASPVNSAFCSLM